MGYVCSFASNKNESFRNKFFGRCPLWTSRAVMSVVGSCVHLDAECVAWRTRVCKSDHRLFDSVFHRLNIVGAGSVQASSRRRTSVNAEMKTRALRVFFVHGVYEVVLARSCLFTTCTIVIGPRISWCFENHTAGVMSSSTHSSPLS